MKNSEDVEMLLKFIEREHKFEFLVRLNVKYDRVCIQVLRKESWTSLNEVFSIIRVEEEKKS